MKMTALGRYYERQRFIPITIRPRCVSSLSLPVKHDYYLTTLTGICAIRGGRLYQLTHTHTYGLAFSGDYAYCSVDMGYFTAVVRFPRHYLATSKKTRVRAEVVYGAYTTDLRGRIHQVTAVKDGPVWAANTSRNSLVRIAPGPEIACEEYAPLLDAFSVPILFDQNHINSVIDYGDFQLFTISRAGKGALAGIIRGKQVTCFYYKNRALHDIYATPAGFILCDMLGDMENKGGLVTEKGFSQMGLESLAAGHAIRGVSCCQGEMLIGLSVRKDARSERANGHARLAIIKDGQYVSDVLLPMAQIYQIVHISGEIMVPGAHKQGDELYALFEQCFGAPVYQGRLEQVTGRLSSD